MSLTVSWEQIALRLLLAALASALIGLNRDEHGHPAGVRTTMLVCLAATLAMLQVNLLLPMSGKTNSSFAVLDLMRLPLGILSGIGFIGAGVIMKREQRQLVTGVTTAATLWFVTVMGLLFGGGQIILGSFAFALGFGILWAVRRLERRISRTLHGHLALRLGTGAPQEDELRRCLLDAACQITHWVVRYEPADTLAAIECELRWQSDGTHIPQTPPVLAEMRRLPGVLALTWDE